MSAMPVVNITMPVFNRYDITQAAILALRKTSQEIPFCLTVVDNGSDAPLVRRLIDFNAVSSTIFFSYPQIWVWPALPTSVGNWWMPLFT